MMEKCLDFLDRTWTNVRMDFIYICSIPKTFTTH